MVFDTWLSRHTESVIFSLLSSQETSIYSSKIKKSKHYVPVFIHFTGLSKNTANNNRALSQYKQIAIVSYPKREQVAIMGYLKIQQSTTLSYMKV